MSHSYIMSGPPNPETLPAAAAAAPSGSDFRAERIARGLTLAEVARAFGVSVSSVKRWEVSEAVRPIAWQALLRLAPAPPRENGKNRPRRRHRAGDIPQERR